MAWQSFDMIHKDLHELIASRPVPFHLRKQQLQMYTHLCNGLKVMTVFTQIDMGQAQVNKMAQALQDVA